MNLFRCFSLVMCAMASASALSEPMQRELLVFGSAELAQTSGADVPVDIDSERLAADILFSVQKGPVKLFGEYLLTNHEHDLERFQIGWEPAESNVAHLASYLWSQFSRFDPI